MKPTAALILTVAAVLVAIAIGSTTNVQAAANPQAQSKCGATYTVQSGDYLSLIASNCNVSYAALLQANPNITNPDDVTIGQVINMPSAAANNAASTLAAAGNSSATSTSSAAATPTASATANSSSTANSSLTANGSSTANSSSTATPDASIPNTGSNSSGSTSAAAAGGRTYTILEGDTLSSIAQSYSISLTDLLNANTDIPDANTIYAGQTINLPSNASAMPSSTNNNSTTNSGTASSGSVLIPNTGGTGNTYTVQSGDTLSAIAVQYNTTVTNLVNANSAITNPDLIFTGQVINIR